MAAATESVPLARSAEEVEQRHRSNRAAWDQVARRYQRELDATERLLKAGHSDLHAIERRNLGDLSRWCQTAIHLQCAAGRDTLSLWIEGARRVVGIDFSEPMIELARELTRRLDAPATWYACDILDAPHELDGTADLVYTGQGALMWLHDLTAWGAVIARLLAPGGVVHVFDEHPMSSLFESSAAGWKINDVRYFGFAEVGSEWDEAYVKNEEIADSSGYVAPSYTRIWPLADVFTALHNAGLRVEQLGEYPDSFYPIFPDLPPELRGQIPLTFSIIARKP